MDEDKTLKAMYYATLVDLSSVVGLIPIVGDIAADVAEDIVAVEIKKTLTPEEYDLFLKDTRFMPDVPAMAKTLKFRPPRPPSPIDYEETLRNKGFPLPPSPLAVLKTKGWAIP